MTEKNEPERVIIRDENLDAIVDELLALGKQWGSRLYQMRLGMLRDEFRVMEVVQLLEYAHDALANSPVEMSEELEALRWQSFGRLVDRIVEDWIPSRGQAEEEQEKAVAQLREFVFTDALGRLTEQRPDVSELLGQELRRRLSRSPFPRN